MAMNLFPYHLLLAARSLRRDSATSAIMLLALALGAGIWSLAITQYVRFNAYEVKLRPTLHQVEILRPHDANAVFMAMARDNPYMAPTAVFGRTQLSYPEYRLLAQSQAPAAQSAGIRAEVVVRSSNAVAQTRMARFTDAAFFSLFERPFSAGGPWQRSADGGGTGVVVLGLASGRALFPRGGALGQTVQVEGRPFRVVGVLSRHQPLNAPWQLALTGGAEDALFLPLGEFVPLGVRPDEPVFRSPVGRSLPALLASDALFVTMWVDLPTAEGQARYRRDLDQMLGPGQYVLRSLSQWRRDLRMASSQLAFFSFMGAVVLLGGGFNLARWLLTKGLSRGAELGIFRALGAPRASLFWRIVAEATLLALPSALLAPLMALPGVWLFNRHVHVVDMPLEVGPVSVLVSIAAPLLVGVMGSLYPAWRLARTPPTVYLGRP